MPCCARILPIPQELVDHVFPFLNAVMCAVIAFHTDDAELGARTAAALGPHRDCWAHHHVGSLGPVSMALALCAAVNGEIDDAVAYCVEAERTLVAFRSNGPLPRFRLFYAEILLRRGSDDDRARAAHLLREVHRDAEELEAPRLAAMADELAAPLAGDGALGPSQVTYSWMDSLLGGTLT